MQKELGGSLDQDELGRLKSFLSEAAKQGVDVIVDLHNYGRYEGTPLGSGKVTADAFADFWKKLASAIKDQPALIGYDIMNEPHDMGGADRWPKAAQAAVDAIRSVDMKNDIHVEGDGWSSIMGWTKHNGNLDIQDPAGKLIYDAHAYFDNNGSGTYDQNYTGEGARADIGTDRLQPFVDWLKATGSKGFIGEFGVPDDDPRWITVLDNFMDSMDKSGISGTYWAGGPWWGDYPLAPMGGDGKPNPQLATLLDHAGGSVVAAPSEPTKSPAVIDKVPTNGPAPNTSMDGTAGVDTIMGGSGGDLLKGMGGGDKLMGGAGGDRLDGGTGKDRLVGGTGNDIYFVDQTGDAVVEQAGAGRDAVNVAFSYRLPNNIEDLILRSGKDAKGTGNALKNEIIGNSGTNRIDGGAGDDILNGANGSDTLIGGTGKDVFAFTHAGDSRVSQFDHILDFEPRYDRIDLSAVDANSKAGGNQAFRFIGSNAFSGAAGELGLTIEGGEDRTLVRGDIDGNGKTDFAFYLDGAAEPLHTSQFVL